METIFNIVVLGNTGVGKSSLLNYIAGKEGLFVESDRVDSETRRTEWKQVNLDGLVVRLVDTPGLSDTDGDAQDSKNIENIVDEIKKLGVVHLFLLCPESSNPRFKGEFQHAVDVFNRAFPHFFTHTVTVFPRWNEWDEKIQAELSQKFQKNFCKTFSVDREVKCFFLDSHCNWIKTRSGPSGTFEGPAFASIREKSTSQLHCLMAMFVISRPCDVSGITPVSINSLSYHQQQYEQDVKRAEILADEYARLTPSDERRARIGWGEFLAKIAISSLGLVNRSIHEVHMILSDASSFVTCLMEGFQLLRQVNDGPIH